MEVGQCTESAMDYLLGNENPSLANQPQIITTRLSIWTRLKVKGDGSRNC